MNFERELKQSLSDLIYVDERPLIRFLPLLLDKLLHLLVRPPVVAGQVGTSPYLFNFFNVYKHHFLC